MRPTGRRRGAAWEQAKDALAEAEADAEQATVDADSLGDQVEGLRRQLREVEEAEDEARRGARAARKLVDELTTAERKAREPRGLRAVSGDLPDDPAAVRRTWSTQTWAMRTVGVEEELLLIDAVSGAPTAVAGAVLADPAGEVRADGGLEAELQQQQIELETAPTQDLAELAAQLRGLAVRGRRAGPGQRRPGRGPGHLSAPGRTRVDTDVPLSVDGGVARTDGGGATHLRLPRPRRGR